MAYFDSDSHLKVHLPMIYINQVVFAVPYGVSIGFNVWSPEPWLNTTRPPRNQWHPMAGATLMMLALEVDQTWHPITHSEARTEPGKGGETCQNCEDHGSEGTSWTMALDMKRKWNIVELFIGAWLARDVRIAQRGCGWKWKTCGRHTLQ